MLNKLAESMSESLATDLSKMDLSKDENIFEEIGRIESCLEVKEVLIITDCLLEFPSRV
ncbi:hypothetical protein [Candidatus Endomicrobiellum agilis]|uniref:hypothetical protein n=1 Tax=Candidatus Endomicrobiellum agilis TaxID=3238957 RepID=UPI003574EEEC|nr:hypothetical protein [Endomicrobium sp.]